MNLTKFFSARLSLFILLFTAAIFVVAFSIFYHFSSRSIERNARTEAENTLQVINLQIEKVLRRVEAVPDNLNWVIANSITHPDSMYNITRNVVRNNPDIYGSAIAFEPHYFKEKGYYFSPYSYRDGGTIRSLQLGNEDYDYFTWEWYDKPKKLGAPCWSEPYYDEGGGQMVMCTYSAPIFDKKEKIIGIFTSDISLEWLTDLIDGMNRSNRSYTFMLSKDGTYIVHPQRERILNKTIFNVADEMNSEEVKWVGEKMLAGEQGMQLMDNDGVKSYIFYAPVPHTQWSLGIVIPNEEVFGDLHRINWMLLLIVGLGLIVLFFVSSQIVSNLTKLQQATSAKEKIESELKIAHDIQMGMLPKIFPPFPKRKEIDLYAALNPAKEVGGDLYDFFMEDDHLYFAIGDVSGKGVPASLFMAVTLSMFRSVAVKEENPASIMNFLNASISENNESNMFVTLFIGILNLNTGSLKYCNAGHNPPLLIHPDGECKWLETLPNIPVGVMEKFAYQEQSLTLPNSGALALYTDGVTEAENTGKELYGEKRLMEIIKRNTNASSCEMIEALLLDINHHVKDNEPSDDVTLMVIKYDGTGGRGRDGCRDGARPVSTLVIPNKIEELPKITQFIEQIGEQINLPATWVMNLNLALEEAVSNVIFYAYGREEIPLQIFEGVDAAGGRGSLKSEDKNETIEIIAYLLDNELVLTLTDSGDEFDPTLKAAPDLTLSAEERPIGGLGIFLIRQIMDKVEYKRENGKNILTLSKKINNINQ